MATRQTVRAKEMIIYTGTKKSGIIQSRVDKEAWILLFGEENGVTSIMGRPTEDRIWLIRCSTGMGMFLSIW